MKLARIGSVSSPLSLSGHKYYDYFVPAGEIVIRRPALRFSSDLIDWSTPRKN